jgi:hypothetical protein
MAAVIYETAVNKDVNVTVNTNEVIIVQGRDRIIVPRNVYDAAQNAKQGDDVRKALRRTFQPLEVNSNISEFGLTNRLTDIQPLVRLPREAFHTIVSRVAVIEETETERIRTDDSRLVIIKAWLNHAKRKWQFEWNGVPVRAPIADQNFLDQIERGEHLLGAGYALDVEITFRQRFDRKLNIFVTDPKSFVVAKVHKVVHRED